MSSTLRRGTRTPLRWIALGFSLLAAGRAANEPVDGATVKRVEAARTTLARATTAMRSLSTEGGYVYKYSPDLTRRTAERPATPTMIAIQPPGTPSMGEAFLIAWQATRDPLQLEAARSAAEALARCQLGSGGWNRIADFNPAHPNEDGRLHQKGDLKHGQVIQHTLFTTFDDNTTQAAVEFLLRYREATKTSADPRDDRIERTLERALRGMLAAQYPNGAWPQRYGGEPRDPAKHPVRRAQIPRDYPRTWPDADYTRFYTLNDNAQSESVQTMLLAHTLRPKSEYLAAARRGADFLLLAQLPEPQPGWAQQYDFTMAPTWARVMEPPAVSSAESGRVIDALLDIHLETGERKYLEAAGPAVAWLRRSAIGPERWARLYELGTNRPIYGDERGKIFYSRDEISAKFARDYNWENAYQIPQVLARYERILREGGDAVRAAEKPRQQNAAALERRVDEIVAALDANGRWIVPDRWQKGSAPEPFITTQAFIGNVRVLSEYLRLTAREGEVRSAR